MASQDAAIVASISCWYWHLHWLL